MPECQIMLDLVGSRHLINKTKLAKVCTFGLKVSKLVFRNGKWNYLIRKWNYFSHFQTSDQKTSSA